MSAIDAYQEKSKTLSPPAYPYLEELGLGTPQAQVPHTLIVTCCDPRSKPDVFWGVGANDYTCIVRNAGGAIAPAIRDLAILDTLFGLKEIAIIKHTDCGSLHITEKDVGDFIKGFAPKDKWAEVDATTWGANTDIKEAVKKDLQWVQDSPLVSEAVKKGTRGFLLDVKTGKVEEIKL